MTTKEKFIEMLTNNGMFENQAKEVMNKAILEIEKRTPKYKITWNRPAKEYPDLMYNLWWVIVKKTAKIWIEKNASQAWFKPMFD